MNIPEFEKQINNATTISEKAEVISQAILSYRKNVRPLSFKISNEIFNTGLSREDKIKLLKQIYEKVTYHLQFNYPNLFKIKLSTNLGNLENLEKNFDRTFLTQKKWQQKPFLFVTNVYKQLNNLPKQPIKFCETSGLVDDTFSSIEILDKENYGGKLTLNSTNFFVNNEHQMLFSLITSISFSAINGDEFEGVEKRKIPLKSLFDETKFSREIDICTYVIPNGNPQNAINILRYDGTGCPHYNQVFLSEKHKQIIGEVAQVPHFHFQNNVENLLYLKKSNKDDSDLNYSAPGCNAIDCEHLIKYLQQLDATPINMLKTETQSYGMPFLDAKIKNLPLNINIQATLLNVLSSPNSLSVENINYLTTLYNQINKITYDDNTENNYFSKLIESLDVLEKMHKKIDSTQDPKQVAELTLIETECANQIVSAMSNYSQKENPKQK